MHAFCYLILVVSCLYCAGFIVGYCIVKMA